MTVAGLQTEISIVKQMSTALQTHLDGAATTLAYLLKIRARNGDTIGITDHDRDLDYDDGAGVVTYLSIHSLEYSSQSASNQLDVDNAEAEILIIPGSAFTDQQIYAGVFDSGKFNCFRVNWADLSMGHYNVMSGTTGAVKSNDGLSGVVELRGLSQTLKQSFIELYSITCRASFGTGSESRFPCGFDASSLWSSDTVLSIDSEEPDRIFTATTTPAATGPNGALSFVPGIVTFTSGGNAGLTVEIEAVEGDVITLRFQTPQDIQASDGYDIRPDCAKRFTEDCIGAYDNGVNFGGEPWIQAGDEASQIMPGANGPLYYSSPAPEPPA